MKAVINEKETPKEPEYPCLMIGGTSKSVILFLTPRVGTVVYSAGCHDIGYYSNSWGMECFTPFTGSITLSND
jgi:hypothetical protein